MKAGRPTAPETTVSLSPATQDFLPNDGMLIRPDRLPPSAWSGHIPFGAWLVAALRPRLLVELGTHHGASYLAFCQTVREQGLDTRCLAVDTWQGDAHAGAYGDEVYGTLRRYHDPLYGAFSELLRMTFDDALQSVVDGSVDLLHIDGLHTYEAVFHDFQTWRPKLSSRAVVLFHDTQVRDRGFGVWRFWDEVRRDHPSFEFVHSHGLGVLLAGDDLPDAVRALARLDERRATQVQRLFARLGEGVAARSQAEELAAALAGREEGLALYRQHATALETQVSELQRDRDAVMGALQRDRSALVELGANADAMRREIAELQRRVAGTKDDLASREAGIEAYRTQAHALEQRVAALVAESAAAHAALEESRGALDLMSTELRQRHGEAVEALVRQHAQVADALMARLEESNARLRASSNELDRILHSRSWRATAWMRRLSMLLRGST